MSKKFYQIIEKRNGVDYVDYIYIEPTQKPFNAIEKIPPSEWFASFEALKLKEIERIKKEIKEVVDVGKSITHLQRVGLI